MCNMERRGIVRVIKRSLSGNISEKRQRADCENGG